MKGKKRKAQRKAVQTNENTKIRIQEVDEEKWICMQAEAYYRALKRIEAQKEIKNPESSVQLTRKEQILYIINFFFFPFKIFGKVKLKKKSIIFQLFCNIFYYGISRYSSVVGRIMRNTLFDFKRRIAF